MRTLSTLAAVTCLFVCTSASAQWMAKVEDDIFSGGKKATLFGEIDSHHSFVFNCDAENLAFAVVGESRKGDEAAHVTASILLKIGQGQIQRITAATSQRNENHWQAESVDREQILAILKQIRDADGNIQVGVQAPDIDFKWSGVAGAAGSTKESDRFVSACKLK